VRGVEENSDEHGTIERERVEDITGIAGVLGSGVGWFFESYLDRVSADVLVEIKSRLAHDPCLHKLRKFTSQMQWRPIPPRHVPLAQIYTAIPFPSTFSGAARGAVMKGLENLSLYLKLT